MPITFTPFYQPRVYFMNSLSMPNDSFVFVLVDLYVNNWSPTQNGASLGNLIQKLPNGNLNISYGNILASQPAGGGLQTFCLEVYKYEAMPDSFPSVTFSPANMPPSTGVTKQIKSKKLTEDLCRPFMFQSLSNNQQYFIGALSDINNNLAFAGYWSVQYPPGSTINGTGYLDLSIINQLPNPILRTLASPVFPCYIDQLATVMIKGTNPSLSGTFSYAAPSCVQL